MLKLSFLESYLGIESYVGDDVKMSVITDGQGEIEVIQFQLYGDSLRAFSVVCRDKQFSLEAELFIPW